MKCKSCGAEFSSELRFCPFCRSEVIPEKTVTTITNNYYGSAPEYNNSNTACPKCGSHSIKFRREEVGNTKSKSSKQVYYRTVAICQSCGYTWNPHAESRSKQHSIWWWILVILFYPISLTIWFIRTPKLKLEKKYRIIIVVAFWLILISLGAFAQKDDTTQVSTDSTASVVQTTEALNSVWNSKDAPLDDFDYYIDGTEVFLKKYLGRDDKIRIPTYYDVDGTRMTVVSLDGTFVSKKVVSVVLPEKLRWISDNCFNSSGIEFLYIPTTLKEVSNSFWRYFHDMEKIYYGGTEDQWAQICSVERSSIDVKQIVFNADAKTLK